MYFYHLTDLHYLSKKYIANAARYHEHEQLQRELSEEALKCTLELIERDTETKYVFITGDVTNNGEEESHKELLSILRDFAKRSGKKLFVITASHDFDPGGRIWRLPQGVMLPPGFNGKKVACRYGENGEKIFDVPIVDREFIKNNYLEFGYNQALAVHEKSLSYFVELDGDLCALMLNDDFAKDNDTDTMPPRAGISPSLMEFVRKCVKYADEQGKTVFAFSHQPFVTPNPIYGLVGKKDVTDNSIGQVNELCNLGIPVIFTGHTHLNNVRQVECGTRIMYDISTGATCGSPAVFRKVLWNNESKMLDVKTIEVPTPEAVSQKGETLQSLAKKNFLGYVETMMKSIGQDYLQFVDMAIAVSLYPRTLLKWRWVIEPFGKLLSKLNLKTVGFLTKKENELSRNEIKSLKGTTALDVICKGAENMYLGIKDSGAQTTDIKVLLAFISVLDDVLETLNIDVKKLVGTGTLTEFIAPVYTLPTIDDSNFTLKIHEKPVCKLQSEIKKSRKGPFVILATVLGLLTTAPVDIPLAGIWFLASKVKTKKELSARKS